MFVHVQPCLIDVVLIMYDVIVYIKPLQKFISKIKVLDIPPL